MPYMTKAAPTKNATRYRQEVATLTDAFKFRKEL